MVNTYIVQYIIIVSFRIEDNRNPFLSLNHEVMLCSCCPETHMINYFTILKLCFRRTSYMMIVLLNLINLATWASLLKRHHSNAAILENKTKMMKRIQLNLQPKANSINQTMITKNQTHSIPNNEFYYKKKKKIVSCAECYKVWLITWHNNLAYGSSFKPKSKIWVPAADFLCIIKWKQYYFSADHPTFCALFNDII